MPRKRIDRTFPEAPDSPWLEEPKFHQEKKYHINVKPLNEAQNQLWNQLNDISKTVVIAHGCAGTGKSYLSMAFAAKQLVAENYKRLVLSRSNIPSTKSLGFFPGTVEEKLSPWLKAYVDYLREFLGSGTVDTWLKSTKTRPAKIIMQPMEVLRGSTWKDSIVLIEEVQNLTFPELKMVLTRIGENSRLILSGDLSQSDINRPGLSDFIRIKDKYQMDEVAETNFTSEEIVRCGFVKSFIKALEKEDSK